MSAVALKSLSRRIESLPGQSLLHRIGMEPRHDRCPCCNSIIYSRRHSRCGVCENPLPASLLFSGAEAAKVDRLLQTERQQHRAWLDRVND
jgi:hypothetical protein